MRSPLSEKRVDAEAVHQRREISSGCARCFGPGWTR